MQALLDFLPVIAFVMTYWITGEMATAIVGDHDRGNPAAGTHVDHQAGA